MEAARLLVEMQTRGPTLTEGVCLGSVSGLEDPTGQNIST